MTGSGCSLIISMSERVWWEFSIATVPWSCEDISWIQSHGRLTSTFPCMFSSQILKPEIFKSSQWSVFKFSLERRKMALINTRLTIYLLICSILNKSHCTNCFDILQVHHISNRATFSRFSSLRLEGDFAEIPSLLLENWLAYFFFVSNMPTLLYNFGRCHFLHVNITLSSQVLWEHFPENDVRLLSGDEKQHLMFLYWNYLQTLCIARNKNENVKELVLVCNLYEILRQSSYSRQWNYSYRIHR